jgi:hypothetical protein
VFVEEPRSANTAAPAIHLHVVLNWFDELKSRVPAR